MLWKGQTAAGRAALENKLCSLEDELVSEGQDPKVKEQKQKDVDSKAKQCPTMPKCPQELEDIRKIGMKKVVFMREMQLGCQRHCTHETCAVAIRCGCQLDRPFAAVEGRDEAWSVGCAKCSAARRIWCLRFKSFQSWGGAINEHVLNSFKKPASRYPLMAERHQGHESI